MIGRDPLSELEGKRDLLINKLKTLDESRSKLEREFNEVIEDIVTEERKKVSPKIYYAPLDRYCTAEEVLEFNAFFSHSDMFISTKLTSLC